VTYAFLFDGGDLATDWELGSLLPAHYGEAEADKLMGEWLETFAPTEQWAQQVAAESEESGQLVWSLRPVVG
jgi:hypothetical protein